MAKSFKSIAAAVFTAMILGAFSIQASGTEWKRQITVGPYMAGHVQGIAVDKAAGCIYFSFTDVFVKTDLSGRVLGTVEGFLGHLGCLDLNPADGKVYGSLEYKNDAIGKGILSRNNAEFTTGNRFYIAIIDVAKIDREGMHAVNDGIVKAVCLNNVIADYEAKVKVGRHEYEHRYGCSGIDGVSFGPGFGKDSGNTYLTVAYGIYGDVNRKDNDYQVLHQYDITSWDALAQPLSLENPHTSGPDKPYRTYFVYTGNTSWGVQNLEYDAHTGYWFMAVYKGKKPEFPNYRLFAVDSKARPKMKKLDGVPYAGKQLVLPLAQAGEEHPETGIFGWARGGGATGLESLGDGLFYISRSFGKKKEGGYSSELTLWRFTGETRPFIKVEKLF